MLRSESVMSECQESVQLGAAQDKQTDREDVWNDETPRA